MERKELRATSDKQAGDEQIRRCRDEGDTEGDGPDDIKKRISPSVVRWTFDERSEKYHMLFNVSEREV